MHIHTHTVCSQAFGLEVCNAHVAVPDNNCLPTAIRRLDECAVNVHARLLRRMLD